jgi:hypothetical protein
MFVVAAFFLAGAVAGLLIGRAWITLVPVLIVLGFIPVGEDSDGTPDFIWAAILLALPMLVGIAIGLAGRRLRSNSPPTSSQSEPSP